MRPRSSATYFAASIVLLIAVIAVYAGTTARRTQAALRAQLEDKGLALAEAFETSSRQAIRSNALLEEALARRLFDDARLVDELLQRPVPADAIAALAQRTGLRRIDLLDREGRPWTPPAPPPMAPGMRMGSAPMPGMMRFMWGRRWAPAPESAAEPPRAVRDRRFWQGTVFGVAIGARSFDGVIAVHADADDVLSFRREVGVQRQLEELARQSGVVAVAVLGADRAVLASAGAAGVGDDPALARALEGRRSVAGFVGEGAGRRFRIVRPLALETGGGGLLAIDVSVEPMAAAWRHDVRAGVALAGAALLAGALGLGLIFYAQHRHLREVRALELAMARRERLAALGDVAAAFAHEVRNPLNAVSIGLQRLRAEFAPEPAADYARFVDLMQGEVRRLNAIVEQFIALARPLPLKPVVLDVADLLHGLAALVEGQAREAGVSVRVDVPADLPALTADRDHLQQVLLNLALNGVQAMPGGGLLTLGAERARDRVVLAVTDTGPGIAPDVLPRIFDPYFTTKPGGLGLGLAIARRIVEAHGGALDAAPAPGGGARFRVVLPLAPP